MKDCFERRSFPTEDDADRFCYWLKTEARMRQTPFHCHRCGRWHIAQSFKLAARAQKAMKRERCVSDRDLHLQLCRVSGMSLDEFQVHNDLSNIRLAGAGAEVVKIKSAGQRFGPSLDCT